MKQTTLFLTAATLCATTLYAAPIQAQSPFAYEFGLLGQATRFEQLTTLGNRLGIGAQLGAFVLRGVAIEWSTDLAPNKSGRTGIACRCSIIASTSCTTILSPTDGARWLVAAGPARGLAVTRP